MYQRDAPTYWGQLEADVTDQQTTVLFFKSSGYWVHHTSDFKDSPQSPRAIKIYKISHRLLKLRSASSSPCFLRQWIIWCDNHPPVHQLTIFTTSKSKLLFILQFYFLNYKFIQLKCEVLDIWEKEFVSSTYSAVSSTTY